jgi:uncharacterized membrane protein YbhN (UPF0104 family)
VAQTSTNTREQASEETGRQHWAGPVAALIIFALVAYLLHRELTHFHVRDIFRHLHEIPRAALLTAVLMTAGSYGALSLYDVLGLHYLHKRVPFKRTLLASFIANAFGHNLGFAAFTGAAFRLRLPRT